MYDGRPTRPIPESRRGHAARTIAIGDVHGCSRALETLLAAIGPEPEDVIVTLGDYVNRGPDSRGVLDRLIELEKQCKLVPLLGEPRPDAAGCAWRGDRRRFPTGCDMGGDATLASYGSSAGRVTATEIARIPDEHVAFLERCRAYHETETHIFVHAKYDPSWRWTSNPPGCLRWESLRMASPARMSRANGLSPATPSQKSGEILDLGHLVCIDTFCFGGGWLTALDVDTGEVWQANQHGELKQGELPIGEARLEP